jgi:SEC-C motif-containing protein
LGKIHAPTAESLMRSRYTAYVMGNAQYIFRTWHTKTRPSLQSLRDSNEQKLCGLKILSTQAGGISDNKGMVEFIASYQNPDVHAENPIQQHREKSLFVKVKGRWLYIDAI